MRLTASLAALVCLASPTLAAVTPANVANLALKWEQDAGGVTGGPILHAGRLYVGSWDGHVYALDPVTGGQIWAAPVTGPIPGRVHVLDDGGICYGTFFAEVGCLNDDGTTRWTKSLTEPAPGAIWSAPTSANGRLFVPVASPADNPCTRGRLVALDLADGDELWRFYTVPEKVCDTDTAVECTVDGECPDGGTCVFGRGGGVTATPAVDPTGSWVYMNTVGCYTFPSIGESDSMFKIDAASGIPVWRKRVDAPEQFGACSADSSIDCGVDADCGAGTCEEKARYHDFGFLNGPLRVEVPDGPGTKTLIVSGSKNGTLYAFEEATGDIAWTNVVRVTPISPGFAAWGMFNGAITLDQGRIYAALHGMAPVRVCANDARVGCNDDGDCPGSVCPPERKHLMAFDVTNGDTVWEEEIGASWSHAAVANGVVYAGTRDETEEGASWIYAHDAATGARLATFDVPAMSTARAAIAGDTVYVGYGTGSGGIRAYSLCANATLDPGEECDAGPGGACCTATCTFAVGTGCDDGDPCSADDQCGAGTCTGSITTADQVGCKLQQIDDAPCGDATLPKGLAKATARAIAKATKLLDKAAATENPAKVEKLRRKILKTIDASAKKVKKAAEARKEAKRITPECRDAIQALLLERRTLVEGFVF